MAVKRTRTHELIRRVLRRPGRRRRQSPADQPACRFESLEARVLLSTTFSHLQSIGGSAIAFADYDNDGQVEWDTGGVAYADYDNDGNLDYFCYSCFNVGRNNGNGTFTTVQGILDSTTTSSRLGAAWGDFNNDGFVDLYVGGYETWPSAYYPDNLFISQGGTFFKRTWEQGIDAVVTGGRPRPARGVSTADFDEDGDLDIYTSNYRLEPNGLWVNDGNGNITDEAGSRGATGGFGHTIGSAWGDMDEDGHLDIFVGNFSHPGQPPAMFLRNTGPSGGYTFQQMASLSGGDWQESYASAALGDMDNDGDLDLFFTTVYGGDAPRMYENNGGWSFSNVTGQVGLGGIGPTYQAGWSDVDDDGDLDLATGGVLYKNDLNNANHYLKVRLQGDGDKINRAAIGAQVRAFVGNRIITRQVNTGTGQGNQNDLTLHFGLGSHSGPVELEVMWPGGQKQLLTTGVDKTIDVIFGAELPYIEDFDDGIADAIGAAEGTWTVNRFGRFEGAATATTDAVSLVRLASTMPQRYSIGAEARLKGASGAHLKNASVIFDYQDQDNFKYAGASVDSGRWEIGQVGSGNWRSQVTLDEAIALNTDYHMQVVVLNDKATLFVDGAEKLTHTFSSGIGDGTVGLATHRAKTVFDNLEVLGLPDVPTKIDFGTDTSPVRRGFGQGLPAPFDPVAGYGWLPGAVQLGADSVSSGNRAHLRDAVHTSNGTFEVEADNGRYDVTLYVGDPSNARDQVAVYLEGEQVDTMDTAAGEILARTYVVDVTDRRLTLTLQDLGGTDALASIAALTLEQSDAGLLVAHLTFDEGAGTTAADTSPEGNDHTGTLVGDAAWRDVGLNGAVSFDGDGDLITVPNSTDINLGIHQALTISAWFLVDDVTDNSRKQVIYEQGGGPRGLNIYVFDGKLYAGGWNPPSDESSWGGKWATTDKIRSGQWHHVALVLNGGPTVAAGAVTAYLDGERSGRRVGSQLWNHSGGIGVGHVNGTTRFEDGTIGRTDGLSGMIDDVRIYDRAMNGAQISQLAQEVLRVPLDARWIGHWSFDEGSGPTAADTSPRGRDNPGTLVGDAAWTSAGLNGALSFDGDGDMVTVASTFDINRGTHETLTISAWFMVDDASDSTRKQVIYEQGSGGSRGLNIYVYDGKLYGGGWNLPQDESAWGGKWVTTNKVQSNQWHHVALVLDGGPTVAAAAVTMYLDGGRIGSRVGSQLWNHSGGIGFGHVNGSTLYHDRTTGRTDGLAGMMDDVRIFGHALNGAEIKQLSGEVLALDPLTALVAYWSFDEGGGPTAYDTSPRGANHDAPLAGDSFWTSAGLGGAVRFDGTGGILAIPNSTDIGQRIVTDRTVSVWFRVDDASIKNQKQVVYEQGGDLRGLNIYVHDGQLFVGGWNRTGAESGWDGTYLSSDQIVSGQWHHVALVLAGDSALSPDAFRAYLDGAMIGSGAGSQLWADDGLAGAGGVNSTGADRTRFHDGGTGGRHGSPLAGSIDELRIHNRALSDIEIADMAGQDLGSGPDLFVEQYDFGTSTSAVEHRFTGATDTLHGSGRFGWVSGAVGLHAADSGQSDPLLSDSVLVEDGTFVVNVPNGTYDLTVHLGSMQDVHDQMGLFLEGSYVETLQSIAGQIVTSTHRVIVIDGQLELALSNMGQPNQYASIAALQVEQVKTFEQTFDLDLLLSYFGTVQTDGADVGDYDDDLYVGDIDLAYLLMVLGLV